MVVPEGWESHTLGECCEILDSQRIPLNSQERALRIGVYPYYGANGIQGYIDDFIFEGDSVLLAEDGGYFAEYASRPIAMYVTGKYWVNNHAHVLRPKREYLLDELLVEIINNMDLMPYITGMIVPKLNQKMLRSIKIPLPPLEIQEKIVAEIEAEQEMVEASKKLIAIYEQKIKDKIASVWGEA